MNYWFLYNLSDGTIYGAPYLGSAEEWTNIPQGCEVIGPFDHDTASTSIHDAFTNPHHYTVVGGKLTEVSNLSALQLQEAINAKVSELTTACDNAAKQFTSSALGTVHTYLADDESMKLLSAEYAFVIGPDYDNNPIPWYTVENDYQNHTALQFRQVYTDGRAYVQSKKVNKSNKVAQAKACTTIDQVNAITF